MTKTTAYIRNRITADTKALWASIALLTAAVAGCSVPQPFFAPEISEAVPPALEAFFPSGSSTIRMTFSKPVTPLYAIITPGTADVEEVLMERNTESPEITVQWEVAGNDVVFTSGAALEPGSFYTLSGAVQDGKDNSLTFSVPFTGYNDRVPRLLFSEIRTEAANPKFEFVELYAASAGNLAGVRFCSAYNGDLKDYVFPAAEVAAGEFIVLHMRKPDSGCIDEVDATDAATALEALDTARDFWMDKSGVYLQKTDILTLEERTGGPIIDAVSLCESKNTAWTKPKFEEAARKICEAGVWASGAAPSGAIVSDNTTATRTINRKGYQDGKGIPAGNTDWYIVTTGGASPGAVNKDTVYTK